ncbi:MULTISPECIES: hypothetical protein [unclassified Wenzhouxiangella]|uniref:hypothetical protein n=1 Tax=unclassified Wenzhouxiangella TaxID=2613841 RepID=UPI000E32AC83|nr:MULTISPECIES: hypothetical protein [unclassified Wenzhouxiangella]RFF27376.1 hypothetical protein DZK25_08220 [Wenzhouxiangella sp. 15181]RFP68804.1 hypothetical protein DZK26_06665 [Wenzhouxiangella sp. 15190]
MLEVLLFGVFVLLAYFVAHHAVMALERRHGRPLGLWRTLWFFLIFLALLLAAQWLTPYLLNLGGTNP